MKILISANTAWNLANFRSGLIRALIAHGHEVVAAAPHDAFAERVAALGCRFVELPMQTRGTSPLQEAGVLSRYVRLFQTERPSVFLGFTIKPNIYGSIAARMFGARAINNISGLGAVFVRDTALTGFVKRLYRHALSGSSTVFFQNPDDSALFVANGIIDEPRTALLPGSGVDLTRFRPYDVAGKPPEQVAFLLVGRLLWDKGIAEYVGAARTTRLRHPEAVFRLLGFFGREGDASVTPANVDGWTSEGTIDYLGETDDVRPPLAAADCVVLPSYYREGTPRTLIEAAAMGRAIITTDHPGCRDTVEDGVNGYLVPPRDEAALAAALDRFVRLGPNERKAMGRRSRELAARRFDEAIVVDAYLDAIDRALAAGVPSPTQPAY